MTVYSVLGRIEHGETVDDILADNADLERETIEAAITYPRSHPPIGRPSGRSLDRCCVKLFHRQIPFAADTQSAQQERMMTPFIRFMSAARGEPDHQVLARRIGEDRVIVTQNARDFRRLIGKSRIHPGLIIVPSVDREGTWSALQTAMRISSPRKAKLRM